MSAPSPQVLQTLVCGPLANNVYLVAGAGAGPWRRRPGIGAQEVLLDALARRGWTLDLILATHQHFDHIAEAGPLAGATGAPIAAHRLEAELMGRPAHPLLFPELEVPPAPCDPGAVRGGRGAVRRLRLARLAHPRPHPRLPLPVPPGVRAPAQRGHPLRRELRPLRPPRGATPGSCALPWAPGGAAPRTRVLPGHGPQTTIAAEGWLDHPPGL